MRWRLILPLLGACLLGSLRAAEVMPAAPRDHFNDYGGIVSAGTAQSLEAELTQFERTTSNQILVVIYPHMQSDSSIEDYTVRVAQSWRVGTKEKKNGAVLFIFSQDRKLYIVTGYGLEDALPDATCKQIIANEITPLFRQKDFDGGVTAGVHAMLAAARGEYRGTGRTVTDRRGNANGLNPAVIVLFAVIFITMAIIRRRGSAVYGRGGRFITYGGWGGGSSGGGSFGGGGGGGSFSGGGGSFGGGGAGGSW